MKFYQPAAKGQDFCQCSATRYSKFIYRSREQAEANMENFKERLAPVDDRDLLFLTDITKTYIVELELAEL